MKMQPLIDIKFCRKCGIGKPLHLFYPNKSCSKGVTGTCRDCSRVRINKWYADNRKRRQLVANEAGRKRKREVVKRFGDKCHDCGNSYPDFVYDFHHLDPSKKDVNPSKGIRSKDYSELEKCVMLCSNCHRIRHFGAESEGEECNHS